MLTLTVCVVSLAARIATRWLTTNPVSSLPGFLWLYAAVTALVALGAIAIGGEALFDFARCDIRGWLGSSVFATICLALAVTGTRRRVLRIATAGVTLAFAAVVLAAVPSQEHAYLGGLQGMNAKVMIVAALLPAVLGAVVIWNTFAGSVARRRGAIAAIVVGGLAAGLFVWRMTLVPADTLPQTNRLEPLLGGVWLGLPLLSIALVGAARMKASSTGWRLTLVVLAAMSGLLTLYAATEQITVRVPYLAYQLGTPRVDPWPDTRLLAVLGVVLAVDAALVIRRAHGNKASAGSALALRLFRLTTASIAVVYFALINFVHGRQEMIRAIVAIDRDSGGIDWVAEGLRGPQEPVDGRNSPATPTPVTDAEHVCAYFGNHGLMCVNTTGRVKWSRTDVGYNGYYGVGFSPILSDGLLVLASDMPDGLVQISALDVRTGRIARRREARGPGSTSGNSRTPLVKRVGGVTALIVWGIDGVRAFNLSTGEDLWRVPLAGEVDLVASMISDADNLYLSDRTGTARLDLSRIAEGRDPLVWRSKVRSNCASPVLCKRLLLTVSDNGIATALRADTGEIAWRQRLDGNYFASPVASPEAVYFTNDEGMTTVAACEDVYREIARNDIAEPMIASLAASRGHLFARTASHLFSLRPD